MLESALDFHALGFGEGAGIVEVVGGFGFDDEIVVVFGAVAESAAAQDEAEVGLVVSDGGRDFVDFGEFEEANDFAVPVGGVGEIAFWLAVANGVVVDAAIGGGFKIERGFDFRQQFRQGYGFAGGLIRKAAEHFVEFDVADGGESLREKSGRVLHGGGAILEALYYLENGRIRKSCVFADFFDQIERVEVGAAGVGFGAYVFALQPLGLDAFDARQRGFDFLGGNDDAV